jgi:hypothetical protein
MALRNWLQSRRTNQKPRTRLGLQRLEDRAVPAAAFLSAFSPGGGSSEARDVAVDTSGNSYLTGTFSGTVDFAPADPANTADTLTSRGSGDAFVAKFTSNDALVWVRRMGGDAKDIGQKLAIDAGGNVFVTGWFAESADFGSFTHTSAGSNDGFVMKLDANGNVNWAQRWGAGLNDTGMGIGVDAAGNVYALGSRNELTGSPNSANHGSDILKFSPTGTLSWTRSVATQHINSSGDMAVDAAGNVYVAGSFSGLVDFDPSSKAKYLFASSPHDGFVLKLTSAGNYGWVTPFVGQNSSSAAHGQSIALDGAGNVVVGGYYLGTVDFNPTGGTTTLPSVGGGFIAKLNNNGALVWAKALAKDPSNTEPGATFVYGLAVDAAGSIYATGRFAGIVDFDPGVGTHAVRSVRNATDTADSADIFAVKLNSAGNFQWAETFGGSADDLGWGVAVSSTGVVHLTGVFLGSVDFDPDPLVTYELNAPDRSFFLLKLRQ